MISKYLLLLLIPAIYARIAIKIRAAKSEADASVQFTGENVAIISDEERKTFNIEDNGLKDACIFYSGVRPTDVFVKSPTPWEDIYHKYNWAQVQRVLKPVRSRVIGVHTKPTIVSTREFENYSQLKTKFSAAISHVIEETVTNSWSVGGELTVGQEITYSVSYAAGSIGGTTSLSYTGNWANDTSKAKSVTLGSTTGFEVEIPPGQAVVASLIATHGTLEIEVDYEASLIGKIIANYHQKLDDHNWWSYPIVQVMKAARLPNNVKSTEKITIGFYTSASVQVRDKKTSETIKSGAAKIIHEGNFV